VERARRLVESVARGRRITDVFARRDAIVFEGASSVALRRALTDRRVEAVERRGKYFWLQPDAGPALVMHFGMTGRLHQYHDRRDRPDYLKLELTLDDDTRLAFTDPRRFGRIRLRVDPPHEPPISRLGFDPLLNLPGPAAFRAAVQRRRTPIKALLLDQGFAAGVGNWIADEVLYQAKIAPHRRANELTDREADAVRRKLKHVITTAVGVDADKDRFPKTWLFHRRWRKPADAVTAGGEPIRFDTLAGRTAAWVPRAQR